MLPQNIELPSNRKFGLFFSFVFLLLGGYIAYAHGAGKWAYVAFAVSVGFFIAAMVFPKYLRPLNKGWAYIGLLIGLVVSPIVLGLIFFGMFTPMALFMRIKGRDELRVKKTKDSSHWITRDPKGPPPSSYKDQF